MTEAKEKKQFYIDVPQTLYFSTKEPVTVKEVIESLKGLETLLKSSKYPIKEVYNLDISGIELYVKNIEKGSLSEEVFVRLFFGSEIEMNTKIDELRALIGDEYMSALGIGIGAILMGMIVYGLYQATTKTENITKNSYNTTNITNNYYQQEAWEKGAEAHGLTADEFRQKIEESAQQREKTVAQGAVHVIAPARNDEASTFELRSGKSNITVDADTIKLAPKGKLHFKKIKQEEKILDATLQFRAWDLDYAEKGWAAVVPDKIDKRVKVEFSDDVDINKIRAYESVRANITVHYKKSSNPSEPTPSLISVEKIITDDE